MKKEIADKWIADLRTPGLKQAKRTLFDGEGHCCLGRLCLVLGFEFERTRPNYDCFVVKGTSDDAVLPDAVMQIAGMKSKSGFIMYVGDELSSMNDTGSTFPEIADTIEQNWENL